ncbi:MAG: hypothetical protein HC902_06545 [Calothrix sp. SM1_5_4]|nr:hypothetical protein [Calothrix sp. SM1_5_4]
MSFRQALATVVFAQIALSFINSTPASASLPDSQGPSEILKKDLLLKDQWYQLEKNISLTVFDDRSSQEPNVNTGGGGRLDLAEGVEVHVLEVSADGRLALLGVDDEILAEMNAGI